MPVDIEQRDSLEQYLRDTARIGRDESIDFRVLAGGVSNRTVFVRRASGESWVLKQALSKLRVPVDWFCAPERIEREALGMQWLAQVAPAGSITRLIFCDPAEHVLAMEAVAEPNENWKSMLLAGRIEPDHFRQFGALLGRVHACREAPAEFDDRSYFEPLRLEPYYSYTASQAPESAAFLAELIAQTRATRTSIVHGDYSPKNVLVHQGRLVLLDHEVIHRGDPAFDIGFSMAHFVSKARHLAEHRDALIRNALLYWDSYTQEFAPDCAACVRHTLGCLLARVAGRSQLEYLGAEERAAQRADVLELMKDPPQSMEDLITRSSSR